MTNIDPLIRALVDCASRLASWLNESAVNADLFRHDPITANLGIDENMLCDLEEIVTGITLKLKTV